MTSRYIHERAPVGGSSAPAATKVNLLLNGGFKLARRQNPASLTTYANATGRTYCADRWAVTTENASVQYRTIDTSGTPESNLNARWYGRFKKITSNGKLIVTQVVPGEDTMALRGRTIRVSIRMRYAVAGSMTVRLGLLQLANAGTLDTIPATFVSAFGAASTDPTWGTNLALVTPVLKENATIASNALTCVLTSGFRRYGGSFVVPSDCKNLVVVVWTNGQLAVNDQLEMSEASLTDGDDIMVWTPRPEGMELTLCQRFCCGTFSEGTGPAQNLGVNTGEFIFLANAAGANPESSGTFRYPVTMRAAPTVTTYNPAATSAQVRDETAAANCTGVGTANVTDAALRITCTGAAGTAVGGLLGLHLLLEAEI